MEIVFLNAKQIKRAEYNPRIMAPTTMEKLILGLKEFGLVENLVVNNDMTLVGGHQRLTAVENMVAAGQVPQGVKIKGEQVMVPCVLVNLDKAKEKALNLALNKLDGQWDYGRLSTLLGELDSLEGFDKELTGFDQDEFTQFAGIDESTLAAMTFGGTPGQQTSAAPGQPQAPAGPTLLDAYTQDMENEKGASKLNPGKVFIVSAGGFIHSLADDAIEGDVVVELRKLAEEFAATATEDDRRELGEGMGSFVAERLQAWAKK